MYNTTDTTPEASESFIEATQLADNHRSSIAWMLIIQITVLGTLSVWLTGLAGAVQVAMFAMLVGFLWYGNSFWLLPFCVVVFGGQLIRSNGLNFALSPGIHLAGCILMLLTLIAGFRYIELRSYQHAFGLKESYRRLKLASKRENNLKQQSWISLVIGQFVRRQWYHTVIAMAIAFALLWRLPASNYWRNEFWMQPVAARDLSCCRCYCFLAGSFVGG